MRERNTTFSQYNIEMSRAAGRRRTRSTGRERSTRRSRNVTIIDVTSESNVWSSPFKVKHTDGLTLGDITGDQCPAASTSRTATTW
jgi:hypothetical protein